MNITVRRAVKTDEVALSRVCLLTAYKGTSAEQLHDYGELPGFVYAVPYVNLPTTFGFVMVDDTPQVVVGYILGSADTTLFEREAAQNWWPGLIAKYPLTLDTSTLKPADKQYLKLFRNISTSHPANINFAPAHLHINILPAYQRQGWGRILIGKAVEYLKGEGVEGVWLAFDPENANARIFYERLGFEDVQGAPDGNVGAKFDRWDVR
jgi:ribosomal protein S18 acetylase RimI-like enzyme